MNAFLSMAWRLVSFRAGPESLPYQPRMVPVLLLFNLLLSVAVQQLADADKVQSVLLLSALSLAVEAFWLAFLLLRRGWRNRWVQTYSALVLVDMVITVLAAPMVLAVRQAGDALLVVAVLVQFVMSLWSIAARGAIYQRCLECGRWRGLLLALAPLFLTMLITLQLFPGLLPALPQGS